MRSLDTYFLRIHDILIQIVSCVLYLKREICLLINRRNEKSQPKIKQKCIIVL